MMHVRIMFMGMLNIPMSMGVRMHLFCPAVIRMEVIFMIIVMTMEMYMSHGFVDMPMIME